jgi:choline dehydrogenase-like flavoprotein
MKTASSAPNFNYGFPTAGPQNPSGSAVMDHVFFVSQSDWKQVREEDDFDFIIIGSGFCALGFADKALKNNPKARILIIERGPFFLPEHFQNLPLPYQSTIGGLTETFPWTLSSRTISQEFFQWQHGMVPFFGGRSTLWSAWCPRPTREEMRGWPTGVVDKAEKYFADAEELLNVVSADKIDEGRDIQAYGKMQHRGRPIYGIVQKELFAMLSANLSKIPSATRVIPAPLAVGSLDGTDFEKFSVPGPLLGLVDQQRKLHKEGKGVPLKIVTNCVVEHIEQQDGQATALETSRGTVSVGDAKIILAMGTIPPTTLVFNSFPQVTNAGMRDFSHGFWVQINWIPS